MTNKNKYTCNKCRACNATGQRNITIAQRLLILNSEDRLG